MSTSPHRRRLQRREIDGDPRFITFSCYERRALLTTNARVADAFVEKLRACREKHGIELFAYVVMPEHIHLLVRPPEGEELGPILHAFKVSFGKSVLAKLRKNKAPILAQLRDSGGVMHFWQTGGGYDRNERSLGAFSKHVHYIHENPVERGLVEWSDEWKWSSVHWWMKKPGCAIECDPPPERHRYDWAKWEGFRKWPKDRKPGN